MATAWKIEPAYLALFIVSLQFFLATSFCRFCRSSHDRTDHRLWLQRANSRGGRASQAISTHRRSPNYDLRLSLYTPFYSDALGCQAALCKYTHHRNPLNCKVQLRAAPSRGGV
jgi:hypothetical protein